VNLGKSVAASHATMNFGVGAGDVLSVTMLAYKLYRRCSDSGTEFKRISEDVRNLYIVLHDIDETVKEDNTGLSRTGFERLERVKKDARGVLEELSLELKKFESLDTKSMRKWDVIRWGLKDVSDIRSRLTSITTNLNMYFHSLSKYVAPPSCSHPVHEVTQLSSFRPNIDTPHPSSSLQHLP
jgi:hypothetical protein